MTAANGLGPEIDAVDQAQAKRLATPRRSYYCEALTERGTGVGTCYRPLDDHGQCDRAGAHLQVQR